MTLAGTRYDLVQFHFHTPSEHKFEGRHAPLEMHLVHSSAAGSCWSSACPWCRAQHRQWTKCSPSSPPNAANPSTSRHST
ncbi:carbonic anhydrase family protein [Kibdelosporangium philippinense]|uniref:carbonic anhydrase family protein n=1 Tax=Kibdelosporangium philippinense TaxID=211113 RepID=UPI003607ADFD